MNRIALAHPEFTLRREPEEAFSRLAELNVPTLLMHGTLDFPHLISRHARMLDLIPDARSVACEGAAHLPSFEKPGFVNAEIVSFCRDKKLI